MEGLNYKEDRREENLGPDRKKGENGDNLLRDSQENEERPRTRPQRMDPRARRQEGGRTRTREGGRAGGSKSSMPPVPATRGPESLQATPARYRKQRTIRGSAKRPQKGQERTGCPTPRYQTDANCHPHRVRPVLNWLEKQGKEEEAKGAGSASRQQSFRKTARKKGRPRSLNMLAEQQEGPT